MNTFWMLYFRENNGNGEYVVFTDEELTKEQAEEHELLGYHLESNIKLTTNQDIYNLPFETTMIKQN